MQKRNDAISEARELAQTDAVGYPELHVTPSSSHANSRNCWCEPEVDYVDPDTGVKVYEHRRVQ